MYRSTIPVIEAIMFENARNFERANVECLFVGVNIKQVENGLLKHLMI